MVTKILETNELTKKYGRFKALDRVSLSVHEGDVYGLIGRNGAGKTTFFKCVMGLSRPSAGNIAIAGESENLNAARRTMGFMIVPAFFSYFNPRDSLEYLCRLKGIRAHNYEINRLLDLVDLNGVERPFKTFSTGMKQRLGIAGALLGSPPIVVLDEPINGLDPQGIIDIRTIIKNQNQRSGTTFMVSSHILSELDLVATRFGFIEQGVLVKEISHELLHKQVRKYLVIEVSDALHAQTLLKSELGITNSKVSENKLTLSSDFDNTNEINRILVQNGISLFDLRHEEMTLEDYFISLIGGKKHD